MKYSCDVCIVGAGPGGALLGLLLAQLGISTILVERHEGIDKEFRGEHINEVGEQILKKYNLYEKIKRCGLLLTERIEFWDDGQVIKAITPDPGHEHLGIHVPQKHLLSVLIGEAVQYKSFQLMMGTRVTGLIHDKKGYVTGVQAKRGEEEVTIESHITIGADGRFSTVRKLANIPYETTKHGYDLLWAKIPSPKGWKPTIKQTLIDEQQLAIFTQAGGFVQIGWNIKEGSFPDLRKQSFEPFIKRVADAFPELSEAVYEHIQSWNDFVLLNVQSIRCQTWVQDGLLIMGDAAHTMSPTGAFGINCALNDADYLSNLIKEALTKKDYSARTLKKFELALRGEVEKLQDEQIKHEESYKYNFAVAF